jgi:UDP-GlcNAc:undecaprenyl-phosphate GlcNAc-1-phosphate transferase
MSFVTAAFISFLITLIITPQVIRLATACGCLDVPSGRRCHGKPTPLWGGVAFFIGVLPVLFAALGGRALISCASALFLIVGTGLIDDRWVLGWKAKAAGIASAATIVIFGSNTVVHHIGAYGPFGAVELGSLAIPFTYLGIIGVTNAINLLDGINGLAGGVSFLGFLFMGIAAAAAGNMTTALICFAYAGALIAFLLFNFPHARVFMGDAGSMFLGFSLSVTAITLTQNPAAPVAPMLPVVVLLLPIFDAVRVLIIRLMKKKNPFHADKGHIHHLIMRNRISALKTVIILWSLSAVFGGVGLFLSSRTADDLLVFSLYSALFMSFFTMSLAWRRRQAQDKNRPPLYDVVRPLTRVPVNAETSERLEDRGWLA